MTAADDYWKRIISAAQFLEVGDSVKGVVEKLDFADRDRTVAKLWIRQDNGSLVTVDAYQKRLAAELCRLKPNVGDRIGVQYAGDERAAPGLSPTKLFIVFVRRPGEAPVYPVSPALEFKALADEAGVDLDDALMRAVGKTSLGGMSADELGLGRAYLRSLVAARKAVAEESRP